MIDLYTSRKIQFKTVETPTARIIFAILVETRGNETFLSEPKIVRVIKKDIPALTGKVGQKRALSLSAPQKQHSFTQKIASPYYKNTFSFNNIDALKSFFARPPTE